MLRGLPIWGRDERRLLPVMYSWSWVINKQPLTGHGHGPYVKTMYRTMCQDVTVISPSPFSWAEALGQ